MGKVLSCLGLKTQKSEHNLTKSGNSFKINQDDDDVLDTRASKENLLDESDGLNITEPEQQNVAKPKEMGRSKTILKAIEQQELLDKTFENDNKSGSVSEESKSQFVAEESNKSIEVSDHSVPPELPEPKKKVERTLSTESDYDVPIASKTIQEGPYDLPRQRIESDYDELPPQRKPPSRTLSEDDYDELPVRKSTDQLNQFSQNNNNDEDNDYDELPTRKSTDQLNQFSRKANNDEDNDYDELPPGKPVKQVKPVQSDEDDYDELPVRNKTQD